MPPEPIPRRLTVRTVLLLAGAGIAVNALLFGVYRYLFLIGCVPSCPSGDVLPIMLSGLRLDLALLGFELCGVGMITLLFRRLRLRTLCLWLLGLTAVHAFVCLSNYYSFAERSQNSGDLILPYITSPYQVYLAVMPFCQQHWLLLTVAGVAAGSIFWGALRLASRLEHGLEPVDLWHCPKTFALALLIAVLPLMMTWQPIIKQKKSTSPRGISAVFANSKHYTHFSDFRQNEAVINPLFEFIGVQIPTALHQTIPYRLTESAAMEQWQQVNGPGADPEFPLARIIHGRKSSPVENVIIIQVEGLSGSVLEQERNGQPVTPYLRQLAREGLYFRNTIQNANFTSGGVFSTAASVPKATWEQPTRRFASHELRGYYGSLAHILGNTNYSHYFCQAFRQSGDDFMSFMSYQGCEAMNYQAFKERVAAKNQLADADSLLGIYDGYLMQEAADLLIGCPTRFTAHLMTCSTHSPWKVPASFKPRFREPELDTFAYLDHSIETFIARFDAVPALKAKTLFVILGDHTSVTFGHNLLERLRIPLIIHGPDLPQLENMEAIWANQIDVLPTVLALMPGDHLYAGLGRNLLDRSRPFTGAVSGSRGMGYFVTEDWVAQYQPFGGKPQLFAITNGLAVAEDRARDQPEKLKHLMKECFARIEIARRLSLAKRIYPDTGEEMLSTLTAARTAPAITSPAIHEEQSLAKVKPAMIPRNN